MVTMFTIQNKKYILTLEFMRCRDDFFNNWNVMPILIRSLVLEITQPIGNVAGTWNVHVGVDFFAATQPLKQNPLPPNKSTFGKHQYCPLHAIMFNAHIVSIIRQKGHCMIKMSTHTDQGETRHWVRNYIHVTATFYSYMSILFQLASYYHP